MDMKEALRSLLQEMIVPELDSIKGEQVRINERLNAVDQRLGDINAHLIDQSRRIDETNKRIDSVRDELVGMMTETNKRIDRLYEVIVRREEHEKVETRLSVLEARLEAIEKRLAA